MRIWLIRHGMTGPGEEGRYQGALDTGLSEKGRTALKKAACSPEHVYVSAAARTRETASILFPKARQISVPDLREMEFGVFEGRTWKEMEDDEQYRTWVDGGCLGTCPGGEDRAAFSERVCNAFLSVLEQEQRIPVRKNLLSRESPASAEDVFTGRAAEDIFIVAHGGTQMAVLERWGVPPRGYYSWQRPCGCGWLLDAAVDGGALRQLSVLQELSFV